MVEPICTFVLTSRNDDHDQGLSRLKVCLAALFVHMEQLRMPSELILVEWNPPKDHPSLVDVLEWPKGLDYWTARAITVSPERHYQWSGGQGGDIKLFVLAARNVGIRRARGEWVLPLNQDTFFSEGLAQYLGPPYDLDRGAFYRAIRVDVAPGVPYPADLDTVLDYAYSHVTEVYLPTDGKSLFTNGSGDFMLMHRDAWHRLKGYPELPLYGLYLDSIQVRMAHLAGYRQIIIPAPAYLYHIEHANGWIKSGFEGLDAMGYRYLTNPERKRWEERLDRGEDPYIINDESWGLGDQDLPERTIRVE